MAYTESMKKTRYVVAVSGGVDSVVLLHKIRQMPGAQVLVAHFDHGIRPDSHLDEDFVRQLAVSYGLPYESKRAELGARASEQLARQYRYEFLEDLGRRYDATVVTAHHLDDLIETVAINMTRGTGWRGLAVFSTQHARPLLEHTKGDLLEYAAKHQLEWREDSTNSSDVYLRNRIRKKALQVTKDEKHQLRALYARQRELRRELEAEASLLAGTGPQYSRYQFTHMGDAAALEVLWGLFKGSLTRPQLARVLRAIKTARPGTVFEAGVGKSVHFGTRHFTV